MKPSGLSRIAMKFADPRAVSKAVEEQKARQRSDSAYEPPRTPMEEVLAALWTKLLVLDRVGRNDDFFQLGGHSLLATQMLARVRDAYNVELPLRRCLRRRYWPHSRRRWRPARRARAPRIVRRRSLAARPCRSRLPNSGFG